MKQNHFVQVVISIVNLVGDTVLLTLSNVFWCIHSCLSQNHVTYKCPSACKDSSFNTFGISAIWIRTLPLTCIDDVDNAKPSDLHDHSVAETKPLHCTCGKNYKGEQLHCKLIESRCATVIKCKCLQSGQGCSSSCKCKNCSFPKGKKDLAITPRKRQT